MAEVLPLPTAYRPPKPTWHGYEGRLSALPRGPLEVSELEIEHPQTVAILYVRDDRSPAEVLIALERIREAVIARG